LTLAANFKSVASALAGALALNPASQRRLRNKSSGQDLMASMRRRQASMTAMDNAMDNASESEEKSAASADDSAAAEAASSSSEQ
jgi:hypothetical protein